METETRFHASQNCKLEPQNLKFTKTQEPNIEIRNSKLKVKSLKFNNPKSKIELQTQKMKFKIQQSNLKFLISTFNKAQNLKVEP